MAKIEKSQGIVIKKTDYKENGNLITILTLHGKVNLIVRGSKKINSVTRNYTNLLTKLDFNATSNMQLNTLTEASIITTYMPIIEDMNKMNVALAMIEKINAFVEEIVDKQLFYNFVNDILDILLHTQYPHMVLALFEIKLLYLLGVAPQMRKCVKCNQDDSLLVFSVENGGMICSEHQNSKSDLSNDESKALSLLYYVKLNKVDDDFFKMINDYGQPIIKVINQFYEYHLDFHSKVKKVLEQFYK